MTHRDEINNMSNEELAVLLTNYRHKDFFEKYPIKCPECMPITIGVIDWLESEVEE